MEPQNPEDRIAELERQLAEQKHMAELKREHAQAIRQPAVQSSIPIGRSVIRLVPIVAPVVLVLSIGGLTLYTFHGSRLPNGTGQNTSQNASKTAGQTAGQNTGKTTNAYNAHGEVPIPGTQTLHLPAGQLTITFCTEHANMALAGELLPDLTVNIAPPAGVADPKVTGIIGDENDLNSTSCKGACAAQIPQDGDYQITTDGQVDPSIDFIDPRLAFGGAVSSR
jgi:hypothetical protein